jgi:hypothetical protein
MRRRWKALVPYLVFGPALALCFWATQASVAWIFSPDLVTTNELSNWSTFERDVVGKDFEIPSQASVILAESYIKGFDYGYRVEFKLPSTVPPGRWMARVKPLANTCSRSSLKIDCEGASIEYLPALDLYVVQSRPL